MAKTMYALLVGVDRYQSPQIPQLAGCENDITAVAEFLRQRIPVSASQPEPLVLLNEQATYQRIIDGFRTFLCQAKSGDVALFYFSGHGSQEPAPSAFWHLEPDKLNETLVCYDSRTSDCYDVADKELAKLIAEVALNQPHIVIILDCCHSGSGTRDDTRSTARIRRAPTAGRERPLSSYSVFTSEEIERLTQHDGSGEATSSWIDLPEGKHVLLSACRDYETAKELQIGGCQHGIFTYYLLDTLRQSGRNLTYRDVFKRVETLVQNGVNNQTPQLQVSTGGATNELFLGGQAMKDEYFTLRCSDGRWSIDGGAVHGIALGAEGDTTQLAIFPMTVTGEQLRDLQLTVADAEVLDVLPQESVVHITPRDDTALDDQQIYRAIVTNTPIPRLGVVLEGDPEGVARVRSTLELSGGQQKPSLYVREVSSPAEANLRVLAQDGRYSLTRPSADRRLTTDIEGYGEAEAHKVVQRLERIARWTTIAELKNPDSRLNGTVQIEIHQITGRPQTRSPDSEPTAVYPANANLRLEYRRRNNKWEPPSYKIRLVNTTNEQLHCAFAYLSEEFGIDTTHWFNGGRVRLEPGGEAWVAERKSIPTKVPDLLWNQGITEYRDRWKLIVSTEEFDATLLEQEELDIYHPTRSAARSGTRNTLNRLLVKNQTRKPDLMELHDAYADWATADVTMTVVRPLDTRTIPVPGELAANMGANVTLAPHPALTARVRLTTMPQAARDLSNQIQQAIFREILDDTYLFQFTSSRGADPGLSAIELLDVQNVEAVTREQPLIFEINTHGSRDVALPDDAHLIPYAFDGEFFLPLGRAIRTTDGIRVEIEHLPQPLQPANRGNPEIGDRSVTGSIRIFLQKVGSRIPLIRRTPGVQYHHPLLTVAEVADDGTVTYEPNPDIVLARVAAADRIVLYIHGIIGDTRGMVASARGVNLQGPERPPPLFDRYQLILAFDYENLSTRIQDTAYALKQRLESVGLGPDHGKTLHIVAHSMGGLVSRWFIENLGGNKVVQHLVLLGTPNGGSPWPQLQDLATTLLTFGINGLVKAVWPSRLLGALVKGVERADVTLDQMVPGSDFLTDLSRSPDPGIPYTVIAGNTTLIGANVQDSKAEGRLKSLAERLGRIWSQRTLHSLADLAFFKQPNDIAVSVANIHHLPPGRVKSPVLIQVEADHISYFVNAATLRDLAEALSERGIQGNTIADGYEYRL